MESCFDFRADAKVRSEVMTDVYGPSINAEWEEFLGEMQLI